MQSGRSDGKIRNRGAAGRHRHSGKRRIGEVRARDPVPGEPARATRRNISGKRRGTHSGKTGFRKNRSGNPAFPTINPEPGRTDVAAGSRIFSYLRRKSTRNCHERTTARPENRLPRAHRLDRPAARPRLFPGGVLPLLRSLRRRLRQRPSDLPLRLFLGQPGPLLRPAVRHDDGRAAASRAHRHGGLLPQTHRTHPAGAHLLVRGAAPALPPLHPDRSGDVARRPGTTPGRPRFPNFGTSYSISPTKPRRCGISTCSQGFTSSCPS